MTDAEILETQLFEVVKNDNKFDVDVVIARLEVLVALGVNVNVRDKDDRVALSYTQDALVRKFLIENGAKVSEVGRAYFLEDFAEYMEKENKAKDEIRQILKDGRKDSDVFELDSEILTPAQKKSSIKLAKILAQKGGVSSAIIEMKKANNNEVDNDVDDMAKRARLVDEEIDRASKGFITKLKKLFGL